MAKEFQDTLILDNKHAPTAAFNEQLMLFKAYIDYFPNFQNIFFWITYDKKDNPISCIVSPSVKNILGYTVNEYIKLSHQELYYQLSERKAYLTLVKKNKQVKNYPLALKKKDGTLAYVELDAEYYVDDSANKNGYSIRGVIRDVTIKFKEQLRKEIAFKIAEKSQRRLINLHPLGKYIYETLKDVIHLSNLYIAIVDEEKKEIIFPYFKDNYTKKESFSSPYNKNGFTEHIITNKKTIIINSKIENENYHKKNTLLIRGKLAENLVGIPLKSDGLVVGALVVQNYTKKKIINNEDIELLKFIATQIAATVDRKLWQDKLIVNEEYFRSLTENSSEIIGIINEDGIIEYISQSLFKILKYHPYKLIGKNINTNDIDFIDIEDLQNLRNILQLAQQKNTKSTLLEINIFRLKDKNGVEKYLEVSFTKNSINNQNKGIIFNAKDITARVVADKKIEFAQNKLQTLHSIEKALISNQPIEKILDDAIIAISNTAFDVDRINICLLNHQNKELKILTQKTKYENQVKIDKSSIIPFDDLFFIDTILKKKAHLVSDLKKSKALKFIDKKIVTEGIQSSYIAPIIINNKVIGTLNLASKSKNYFDDIDTGLIKEITTLLAVVINDSLQKNEIEERKNDLTNIFNNANESIIRIDTKGNFLDANAKTLQLFGYSYKALLNLSVLDITFPKDINKSKKVMLDLKNGKARELTFEKRYLHQSGKVLNCKVTAKAIFNANQEFQYFLGLITDITDLKKATQQVDELTKALNNSASIVFTNCNGEITNVNDSIFEMTGYTKKELIGQTPRIFRSGTHSTGFYKMLWATILSGHTWKGEIRNKKKDGTDYWLFTTITPIFDEGGKIEQFLAIRFDITEEKKAKTNLIKEVIEAQEKERERFAMEIHDGLGQTLLAAKMNLNAIGDSVNVLDKEDRTIFNNSVKLLTEAIQEARNISHGLMSRVLNKFGLAYAVNEIVSNINTSLNFNFNFQHNIGSQRFSEELEMGVYRTLQELINNILKHSKATKASLKITKGGDHLTIIIQDNGLGLTKQTILNPKSGGIGLKNMKSRIEYLGGLFEIDETIKKGTRITIHISLN